MSRERGVLTEVQIAFEVGCLNRERERQEKLAEQHEKEAARPILFWSRHSLTEEQVTVLRKLYPAASEIISEDRTWKTCREFVKDLENSGAARVFCVAPLAFCLAAQGQGRQFGIFVSIPIPGQDRSANSFQLQSIWWSADRECHTIWEA